MAALLVVFATTFGLMSGPAAAATVQAGPYAYWSEYTGDSSEQRCTMGTIVLDGGGGSGGYVAALSESKYHYWCPDGYSLNAGSIKAQYILIWWNQGSPVVCGPSELKSNTGTTWHITSLRNFGASPCGGGTYSATGLYSIYALAQWRNGMLTVGYIYY